MTWALSSSGAGTRIDLTFAVGGYLPNGFERAASAIDQAYTVLLARLRRFIETGKP